MYLVLPSNSSIDLYPDNKVSHFTVQLPKTIDLDGSYEIALTEIFYPHSWFNLEADDDIWIEYHHKTVTATTTLHEGSYPDAKSIIDELMNNLQSKFRINRKRYLEKIRLAIREKETEPERDTVRKIETEIQKLKLDLGLEFNSHTQLVQLSLGSDSTFAMSTRFANILGFDREWFDERGDYYSSRLVDMTRINAIYMYCDLVEPRVVGDTLAPLMGVIAVEDDKEGKNVWIRYTKLQYHPVVKRNISDITISLCDETGQLIRFRKGKAILVLHLRRQKLQL